MIERQWSENEKKLIRAYRKFVKNHPEYMAMFKTAIINGWIYPSSTPERGMMGGMKVTPAGEKWFNHVAHELSAAGRLELYSDAAKAV